MHAYVSRTRLSSTFRGRDVDTRVDKREIEREGESRHFRLASTSKLEVKTECRYDPACRKNFVN